MITNPLCLTVGNNDGLSKPFPMKIYPNPATDKTFIELQNGGKQSFVRVFDRTGKLYYANQSVAEQIELNTNAYPTGMYLIQVELEGKFQTKKLIIE